MRSDDDWAELAELWQETGKATDDGTRPAATFARRHARERLSADVRLAGAVGAVLLILGMAYAGRWPGDVVAATLVFAVIGLATTLWSRDDPASLIKTPRDALGGEVRRTRRRLRWAVAGLGVTVAAVPYVAFVLYRQDRLNDPVFVTGAIVLIMGGMLTYARAALRDRKRLAVLSYRERDEI